MSALSSNPRSVYFGKDGPAAVITGAVSAGRYVRRVVFLQTHVSLQYVACSVLLVPVVLTMYRYLLHDYQKFLSLGPGGTPSTFTGYLWVTFLKVFFSRTDTYVPPIPTAGEYPTRGYLRSLPRRNGPRPVVAGIAPHRQVTQQGTAESLAALKGAFGALKAANPDTLSIGISCFEKHCMGLFFTPATSASVSTVTSTPQATTLPARLPARLPNPRSTSLHGLSPLQPNTCETIYPSPPPTPRLSRQPPASVNPTCGHPAEIVHLHTTESSMHLTLHPLDAAVVLANGWGERHPLAGRGPWVPAGFVMVYAPRDPAELAVAMRIVRAGAWWVGGVRLADGGLAVDGAEAHGT